MVVTDSIASKFREYEYTIKLLTVKLEELAAENESLRSGLDAHGTLRMIYTNQNSPEGNRIKAAQAALTVEKPRLAMTAYAGKNLTNEVVIPLADLVRRRRARQDALEGLPPDDPKYLEWIDRDHTDLPPGSDQRNSNGSDGDNTAG
jgi:hypothetical protein